MLKTAVIGLGKMGLSHQAILNASPKVDLVAICDTSSYLLGVLRKYTGVQTYNDYRDLLDKADLDAVVIATPTKLHAPIAGLALERNLHVFCEKPLCLDDEDGRKLADLSSAREVVTQVGYHHRYIATFQEVDRLLRAGAIGRVTNVLAEAYGPVVLRPQGSTWRSSGTEGGGCLYDYAAHPANLLNWYFGEPLAASGTVLTKIFSRDIEDAVAGTLHFEDGVTASVSVNWSDESVRKMTTRVSLWGTRGHIFADRQECRVFLRGDETATPAGYQPGWNVKYTTELTSPVDFYLRGEEYSAQLDAFVGGALGDDAPGTNSFSSAAITDRTLSMMRADAERGHVAPAADRPPLGDRHQAPRRRLWSRFTRPSSKRSATSSRES